MKKNTIGNWIFSFLLTCFFIVSAAHAATPTLEFQTEPGHTTSIVNNTLTLNFVVQNLAPQPNPINGISFPVNSSLFPTSPTYAFSCGTTFPIYVPANGTCIITVTLNTTSKTGTSTQSLNLNYGVRQATLFSNSIKIDVVPIPTLEFVPPQPIAENMFPATQQVLAYTVINTSDFDININETIASPTSALVNETYSNNCSNVVHAKSTCSITVTIDSLNTLGAVNQNLQVSYNSLIAPQILTLTSNPIAFSVVPLPPELFFQTVPTASNMETNSQQVLTYTVGNSSAFESISLLSNTISFTSGSSLVGETVSNNCNSIVLPSGTCNIIVTIDSLATTGNVAQNLVIQYNSVSNQQIQTLTSPEAAFQITAVPPPTLAFVAPQPTPSNMDTNSSQTLTYTVENSSATESISLQSTSIAFTQGSSLVQEAVSNSCGSTVPASSTCNIIVNIDSLVTAGDVIQNLVVLYNSVSAPQIQTITSQPASFQIIAPVIPSLVFVPPQPTAQNMAFDSQQVLVFAVLNKSSTTEIAFTTTISPVSNIVTESITNDCGSVVPAHKLCHITLTIDSGVQVGQVNQILNVDYTSVVEPQVHTISSNPIVFEVIGLSPTLSFQEPVPSAQDMQFDKTQTLVYTVKNSSIIFPLTLDSVIVTPSFPSLITETITNDCSGTVSAGGTCAITVEITSLNTVGAVNQTLDIVYTSLPDPLPQTLSSPIEFDVVGSGRTITFNNQCPFTVWFGMSGGSVNGKIGQPCQGTDCTTACNTNADCYANTQCINSQCFAVNPIPANNSFQLDSNTSNEVTIPIPANDINPQGIIWSGTVSARTGCSGVACQTSQCTNGSNPSQGVCTPGVGFTPPNAQAEFTLLNTNSDSYNLSMINGFNVPLVFGPDPASSGIPSATNPYTCGTAGAIVDQTVDGNTIGQCSWEFTPPSAVYVNVNQTAPTTPCTTNAQCGANVCGTTLDLIKATASGATPATVCGQFLGFWSGNQICSVNSAVGSPFFCSANASMPSPFTSLTMTNLYQCESPNGVTKLPSCYTSGSENDMCCGCVNWQTEGVVVPTDNTVVTQCVPPSTAAWTNSSTGVLPAVTWAKQACGSSYVYPFDDATSSFTCTNEPASTVNTTNYIVTFCPGGKTGQ